MFHDANGIEGRKLRYAVEFRSDLDLYEDCISTKYRNRVSITPPTHLKR